MSLTYSWFLTIEVWLSVVLLSHTLFSFLYILLRLIGLMFMHARMQARSVGPTLVLVTANIRLSLMSPLAGPLVHILIHLHRNFHIHMLKICKIMRSKVIFSLKTKNKWIRRWKFTFKVFRKWSKTFRQFVHLPREGPDMTSIMCPPDPHRDRKRRLNGAVCRNHRIKRVVPCRCKDGHVKEPYEMSMALGARP